MRFDRAELDRYEELAVHGSFRERLRAAAWVYAFVWVTIGRKLAGL
jgi:hypothetical protein